MQTQVYKYRWDENTPAICLERHVGNGCIGYNRLQTGFEPHPMWLIGVTSSHLHYIYITFTLHPPPTKSMHILLHVKQHRFKIPISSGAQTSRNTQSTSSQRIAIGKLGRLLIGKKKAFCVNFNTSNWQRFTAVKCSFNACREAWTGDLLTDRQRPF